jgi:hypothetical protein
MTTKSTIRRLTVGSLVGSLAMIGSVVTVGQGIAQAEEPGPVPNLPAPNPDPSNPNVPLPGGGG